MATITETPDTHPCSVAYVMTVLGGKWKLIVLFHLLPGRQRFGELQRQIPGITQRMLTLQLRELEADGLVARRVYRQVPPRVEYSLTARGRSLRPVLLAVKQWGDQHRPDVA